MVWKASQAHWRRLAVAASLFAAFWALAPRIVTNRPSYTVRELAMVASAALATPCAYALGRLIAQGRPPASRGVMRRNWLRSAAVAFSYFDLVTALKDVPGNYPDDKIPGLESFLLAGLLALILTAVTVIWAGFDKVRSRLGAPRREVI